MSAIDAWTKTEWDKLNTSLTSLMRNIRVAQKVFPTVTTGDDKPVPADTIDFKTGIPSSSQSKGVVRITKEVILADSHVRDLPNLDMAMNQVMVAAQTLALSEDMLFFEGENARVPSDLFPDEREKKQLGGGLLGEAQKVNKPISVDPPDKSKKGVYGAATYAAVVAGIAHLAGKLQGPPYALFLDPLTYGDANSPLQDNAIITPASAIKSLVEEGGFFLTPGLPNRTGLLVSLGGTSANGSSTSGSTTKLFIGTAPIVEFSALDSKGFYHLTARESLQFNSLDPRSLIKLEFN
jgi:hypothetical protein